MSFDCLSPPQTPIRGLKNPPPSCRHRHQGHLGKGPRRRRRRPRRWSTPGTPRRCGTHEEGASTPKAFDTRDTSGFWLECKRRRPSATALAWRPDTRTIPDYEAAMGADSEGRSAAICPLRPRLAPILQHARQPKADGQLDCAALRAYGFILGGAFRSGRAGGRLGSRAETG